MTEVLAQLKGEAELKVNENKANCMRVIRNVPTLHKIWILMVMFLR
jgi:hypothetical protein